MAKLDFEDVKIEICLLKDEMNLLAPSWSAYSIKSGSDIIPVTEQLQVFAMNLMQHCSARIQIALDQKQRLGQLSK